MKNSLLLPILKTKKRTLFTRLGLELVHSLLAVAASWELANVVNDVFINNAAISETAPNILVLFLILSVMAFLRYRRALADKRLSSALRHHIREQLHPAILNRVDSSQSSGEVAGKTLTLALDKVDALDNYFITVMPTAITFVTLTPLILLVSLIADPISALIFLVTLPVAPFILSLIGRLTQKASEERWHELTTLEGNFTEFIKTVLTLKLYRQIYSAGEELRRQSHSFSQTSLTVLRLAFTSAFTLELITTLAIALVAVTIGLRLLDGDIEFLPAFFILVLAPQLYQPLRDGGIAFHEAMEAKTAEDDLRQQLISDSAEIHRSEYKILVPPAVELRNISYRYTATGGDIISNLSAKIPSGKITVITGASGSGKSTLIELLAGIIAPTGGEIFFGTPPEAYKLKNLSADSKRKLIAYVPQEPHIFRATLAENVTLGKTYDKTLILEAIKKAQLEKLLASLPQGLSTPLGDGGHPLSLGERHRLGLARSIISNRPLILLDEISAGLDLELEQKLIEVLKELANHRTLVLTSHREAIIRLADVILPLEQPYEIYK